MSYELLKGNNLIEEAIEEGAEDNSRSHIMEILLRIEQQYEDDKSFFVFASKVDENGNITLKGMTMHEKNWLPILTTNSEVDKCPEKTNEILPIRMLFNHVLKSETLNGIVINPYGKGFFLKKDFIRLIMDMHTCFRTGPTVNASELIFQYMQQKKAQDEAKLSTND